MLKEEDRTKIGRILSERLGMVSCPICKKGHFSLVDGYSSHALTDNYHHITLGGKMIPFVMLACDNCGFLTHHALGALGLLNGNKETASSIDNNQILK